MEKILIRGGIPLKGKVRVSGAKNAAVAIMPAAILSGGVCTIDNLPYINDTIIIADILKSMGADVEFGKDGRAVIDAAGIHDYSPNPEHVQKMRASYYLLGALLGRFGRAEVALPGGCNIGARPIDQHLKGLTALGAKIEVEHGMLIGRADKLVGTEVYLDVVSVGATINIMLAAVYAEGVTTIVNAAKEPHVVDLASFLNNMGAKIKGAGTDTIRVTGVPRLKGCSYSIIPDQIEAGTWMIAAAATGGDVVVENIIPVHMEAVVAKLLEMGVKVDEGEDSLRVYCVGRPRAINIKTLPYPGFPTDLQQPMTVLLSTATGVSVITENIFESRYKHINEIRRMGASIKVEDRVAIVEGVDQLTAAPVTATDLRAGAALVVAGLMARGVTEIGNVKYIDRGYEDMVGKLIGLGADVKRVKG